MEYEMEQAAAILAMDEDSQDSFFAVSDDIELEECKPLEEDED